MALLQPFPQDAKTYEFEWLRRAIAFGQIQEGVFDAGDFKVTDGSGADLRVDVAAGLAAVLGDTGFRNALFLVVNDAAIANAITLDASHATLPRVDQIILRISDTDDLGSASDTGALEKLTGVPTSGATLDNRNGAAALPNDCLRLADILVPAAATSLLAANIRDRRPWARGAHRVIRRTAGNYTASNINLTLTLIADDATVNPRIECSGAPLVVEMFGTIQNSVDASRMAFSVLVDSALPAGLNANAMMEELHIVGVNRPSYLPFSHTVEPTPGSHKIGFGWRVSNTGTLLATADNPLLVRYREDLRQNTDNG